MDIKIVFKGLNEKIRITVNDEVLTCNLIRGKRISEWFSKIENAKNPWKGLIAEIEEFSGDKIQNACWLFEGDVSFKNEFKDELAKLDIPYNEFIEIKEDLGDKYLKLGNQAQKDNKTPEAIEQYKIAFNKYKNSEAGYKYANLIKDANEEEALNILNKISSKNDYHDSDLLLWEIYFNQIKKEIYNDIDNGFSLEKLLLNKLSKSELAKSLYQLSFIQTNEKDKRDIHYSYIVSILLEYDKSLASTPDSKASQLLSKINKIYILAINALERFTAEHKKYPTEDYLLFNEFNSYSMVLANVYFEKNAEKGIEYFEFLHTNKNLSATEKLAKIYGSYEYKEYQKSFDCYIRIFEKKPDDVNRDIISFYLNDEIIVLDFINSLTSELNNIHYVNLLYDIGEHIQDWENIKDNTDKNKKIAAGLLGVGAFVPVANIFAIPAAGALGIANNLIDKKKKTDALSSDSKRIEIMLKAYKLAAENGHSKANEKLEFFSKYQ